MNPVRAVVEVTLIALGVLLGLSAEAWLGSRGERRLEAYYLEALKTELEANVTWLSETIERHEEGLLQGKAMIELHLAEPESASVPLDDFVILFGFSDFNPVTATVDQLVASGDPSLLRSEGLRSALARWYSDARAGAEYVNEDQWANWNFVSQPFFEDSVGLVGYLGVLSEYGFDVSGDSLTVSEQVAGVLAQRMLVMRDVVIIATGLRSRAEAVLVELEAAR